MAAKARAARSLVAEEGSRTRARTTGHPRWAEALGLVREGRPLAVSLRSCEIDPKAVESLAVRDVSVALVIETAKAAGEMKLLGRLETDDDPRAAQWLLERLYPKAYHLPNRVQLGADPDSPPLPVAAPVVVVIADARDRARDDYTGPLLPGSEISRKLPPGG